MKKKQLFNWAFLCLALLAAPYAKAQNCSSIMPTVDPLVVPCNDPVNLNTPPATYSVDVTPGSCTAPTTGTVLTSGSHGASGNNLNCDDCFIEGIILPFTFSFFGTPYTEIDVTSNGFITFGDGFEFAGYFPSTIPNVAAPNNFIAGVYGDLHPTSTCGCAPAPEINMAVGGVTPNQFVVINYINIPGYSCNCAEGLTSFQIILNEDNSFRINIIDKPITLLHDTFTGTEWTWGAESADGNFIVTLPGRNWETWSATNDCRTVTPICTFVDWTFGGVQIGTTPALTHTPAATGAYSANYTCGGTPCSRTVGVTVAPACCTPFDTSINPAATQVCGGGAVPLNPTTTGGVWSVAPACPGCIVGDNFVAPNAASIYTVTYDEPATGGFCDEIPSTADIEVVPTPNPFLNIPDNLCLAAEDYPRDFSIYGGQALTDPGPALLDYYSTTPGVIINADGTGFDPAGVTGTVQICLDAIYDNGAGFACTATVCDNIVISEPITATTECQCTAPNATQYDVVVTVNGGAPAGNPAEFYNISFAGGIIAPLVPPTNIGDGGTFTITVAVGQPYTLYIEDTEACDLFIGGTCGPLQPMDYIGLSPTYCVTDPAITLYDWRTFYPTTFPVVCGTLPGEEEGYTWYISSDGGTTFDPAGISISGNGLQQAGSPFSQPEAVFSPTGAGPGMHVIRYCIDLSNCPDYNPLPGVPCEYCTDQVTYVFPEFNAQFAVPQTICENDTPLDLILTDEAGVLALFDTYEGDFDPTGEIREEEVYVNWFGDGVMELPLASATNATGGARGTPRALFDPAVAGPGLHIITVEVGYGDCQHTYTQAITVTTGNPAIQDVTVCESPSGTINLVAMLDNTPLGGLWTFSNPDGIINFSETNGILTYQIDPGALPATPGVYTLDVTYTLCGVVSAPARITVTGATETGFDLLSTWCEDAGDITLADFTAQGGGTWYLVSENGTDIVPPTNINATFGGTILVGGLAYVAGQSTLEILYQPAAGGCGVPITQFITVYEAVDATVVPVSDICDTDPPLDLSALEAGTQGGVWTSEGPDGNAIQLGTTLFDTDIEGNYHLTYTVTNGTCTESSTFYLKVHRLLDPSIGNVDICESPSGTVNLNALKFPTTTPGGTWSIVGGTGTFAGLSPSGDQLTYLIDPTATPPYTIEVQYTLTGDAGAPAACDFELSVATITITGATETGFDLPSTWCEDAGDINLADFTASGGGVWYLMSLILLRYNIP